MDVIAQALSSQGCVVVPGWAAPQMVEPLCTWGEANDALFREAKVGRPGAESRVNHVRADRIFWLEGDFLGQEAPLLTLNLESLRLFLNRSLFMGLGPFRGHLSLYEKGAFYRRHLDSVEGIHSRVLTLILFLNSAPGGELRLYPKDRPPIDVPPEPGKLVLFLSGEIEHEVLPASGPRRALSGWFY